MPSINILFVDDEPRVLDGLRRALRGKRNVWSSTFAASGADAERLLDTTDFDVVVSDMRMPGMDGAELLRRVSVRQPQAIRIVLSGQMDEAAAARVSVVAHRFLSKPCDPTVLEGIISRALELRSLLDSERFRQAVGSVGRLPSLPSSAAAINRVMSDEASSLSDAARIIEGDTAMAAKILQLVNSAFFGVPRNIVRVEQAVSYLGLNTIRNLVLAHSLFSELSEDCGLKVDIERDYALLASRLAPQLMKNALAAQMAATAALLHDVGVLVFASRLPREYRQILDRSRVEGVPVHELERQRFGASHAEIGAYLLGLWGLPHDVIEAVATHHDGGGDTESLNVNTAVRVALALAAEATPGHLPASNESQLRADVERFGLTSLVERLRRELPVCPTRRHA